MNNLLSQKIWLCLSKEIIIKILERYSSHRNNINHVMCNLYDMD